MLECSNSAGSSGGGGAMERISGDDDEAGRNNRWPPEETLALLKIRSDMDVEFRDPNPKIARWIEVSRKLGEIGYHRTAKKCKEKFENIYKYHRRTKEGKSGRQNGKNYRFFDQLEVFDQHSSFPSSPSNKSNENFPADTRMDASTSATSNSSKGSSGRRVRKKRKLEVYFESLMNEVLKKQEILQNKLMEAMEKSESDRDIREESRKIQELARRTREKEIIAQERAVAAAKDAAVIAFLQKISDQNKPLVESHEHIHRDLLDTSNNVKSSGMTTSSRWPRVEVEALIRVRTNLDFYYQDNNGAKGSLWEEISAAMTKLGYNRNAKRCKEKWENINKYYKRVKESKKKRPEDSKTCPYFHMLDCIYEMKSKKGDGSQLKAEEILMQMMCGAQEQEPSMTENVEDCEENAEDDDHDQEDFQAVVNNVNCITSSMATME